MRNMGRGDKPTIGSEHRRDGYEGPNTLRDEESSEAAPARCAQPVRERGGDKASGPTATAQARSSSLEHAGVRARSPSPTPGDRRACEGPAPGRAAPSTDEPADARHCPACARRSSTRLGPRSPRFKASRSRHEFIDVSVGAAEVLPGGGRRTEQLYARGPQFLHRHRQVVDLESDYRSCYEVLLIRVIRARRPPHGAPRATRAPRTLPPDEREEDPARSRRTGTAQPLDGCVFPPTQAL